MGRSLALALALGTLAAGCGGRPAPTSTATPGPPPALGGTFATVAAAGSDGGAAVVVSSDEDGGPATTLWLSDGEADPRPVAVPSSVPLYAVSTWFAGERVAVMGAACEAWTSGEAPTWVDEREDNVPTNCGGTRYELWLWDRTSSRWDQVPTPELDSEDGYALLHGDGATALFLRRGPGSPGSFALAVDSGTVTPLPDPPTTDGSAEARFTPCVAADGQAFGLLGWSGPAPSAVEGSGWSGAVASQANGTGSYLVLAARGGAWEPVPVDGAVEDWSGVTGCGPDGIWGGRPGSGAVVAYEAGTATTSPLPPLPIAVDGSAEVSLHRAKADGRAIAVVQAPPGEAPDAPRRATAFLLDGDRWRALPTVPIGPGSSPFVDGTRLAALALGPGRPELQVHLR